MAVDVDTLLTYLGGYGCFQVLTFVMLSMISVTGSMQQLVIVFLSTTPEHHCNIPNRYGEFQNLANNSCKQYVNSSSNKTESCRNGWEYASHESIVPQWDLVCSRAYLIEIATTVFMGGTLFGGLIITPLADRFGRRWVIVVVLLLHAILGSMMAAMNNFVVFLILRFCVGALNQAGGLVAFVAITESFPPTHRNRPGMGNAHFYSAGMCLLALLAWLLPNWRHLQLAVSAPCAIFVALIWLYQESIPWLVMKGKLKQAEQGLERIAKVNKIALPKNCLTDSSLTQETLMEYKARHLRSYRPRAHNVDIEPSLLPENDNVLVTGDDTNKGRDNTLHTSKQQTFTTIDLFRYPRIRRYTLLLFLVWFIISLDYQGISLSITSFHGDPYLNFFISGLVEVPANIISMVLMEKIGRRWPLAIFAFISGLANIGTAFTPEMSSNGTDLRVYITVMAMLGKSCITGAFSIIFVFASEIFPTVLRNAGVGFASLADGIGGIIAPLILLTARERTELPRAIFGCLAIVAAAAVLLLPETRNRPLPETVEDVENSIPSSLCYCGGNPVVSLNDQG